MILLGEAASGNLIRDSAGREGFGGRLGDRTSAAKAGWILQVFIAALKRCATQKPPGCAPGTAEGGCPHTGTLTLGFVSSDSHTVEGAVDEEEGDQEESNREYVGDR